jgi:hypothetical protein
MDWITQNWVQVVAGLWLLEQLLRLVSELTPWKWDDNIVKIFSNILKSFFPKKQP